MLFNTDIVHFVWKTDEGEAESIVLLIFIFSRCLRDGGRGQRALFGTAEITSFSSRDFSRNNKHDTF